MTGGSAGHGLPGGGARADARGPWFRVKLVGAFAAIYLIWGSNFLAIRYAVETIPPFFLMGVRSLLAGALLVAWARSRGAPRPAAVHWRAAAAAGALLFLGCHGTLAWAEQRVPSGLAALMLATIALWLPLLDWLAGGRRPSGAVWSGLALAIAGVALLTSPGLPEYRQMDGLGALVLLASAFFWAAGSIASRRLARPSSAVLTTGMQLVAGGVLLCLVATLAGETAAVMVRGVSARSLWGFAYMVGLASIVGFTAYTWLLRVASPSAVGSYALVLPIVALVVGWALADEAITSRTVAAATLTIAGVALIMSAQAAGRVGARTAAALRPAWRVRPEP